MTFGSCLRRGAPIRAAVRGVLTAVSTVWNPATAVIAQVGQVPDLNQVLAGGQVTPKDGPNSVDGVGRVVNLPALILKSDVRNLPGMILDRNDLVKTLDDRDERVDDSIPATDKEIFDFEEREKAMRPDPNSYPDPDERHQLPAKAETDPEVKSEVPRDPGDKEPEDNDLRTFRIQRVYPA